MNVSIRNRAIQTICSEAEAIYNLQYYIDESFEKAVHVLHKCAGRIVVSGIGKSAIVAQKIVATFNSTGTSAVFMHAAEAIHGDAGMVQPNDVVLILSKSGESPEIKVLVQLLKNFGNVLIAVTGNVNSYLAHCAHIIINTTVTKEACIHNLAPTNSTAAQMAMGDALAVCLMELKGFTEADFAKLHPGGNLGKRLFLRVADIFPFNAKPAVKENTALKKVITEISAARMGATSVVDDYEKVIGIITDGDVRRLLEKTDSLNGICAGDILTKNPKTILPESLAVEAWQILKQFNISQLIVADATGSYLGMIHVHDLMKEGFF